MKKLLSIVLVLIMGFVLVGCSDEIEDVPDDVIDLVPLEPSNPIEEEEEEHTVLQALFTLDEVLRVKNEAYTFTLDVVDYKLQDFTHLTLRLKMTGSYDNPITINRVAINDVDLDLNIEGLPTKASEVASGLFDLNGYSVEVNRATNYKPLRIKSTVDEVGYITFNLENIDKIEFDLVFTTGAVNWFEVVEVELLEEVN